MRRRHVCSSLAAACGTALLAPLPSLAAYDSASAPASPMTVGEVPPFAYRDAEGALRGMAVDMIRLSAQRMGEALPSFELMPFARALDGMRKRAPSFLMPLARIVERESRFDWVFPMIRGQFALFARAGSTVDIDRPEHFGKLNVGTLRSVGMDELSDAIGFASLHRSSSVETGVRMLMAGRFDALLCMDHSIHHVLINLGLGTQAVRMGRILRPVEVYLAAFKGVPPAQREAWCINLSTLRQEGALDAIQDSYRVIGPRQGWNEARPLNLRRGA